jgi:hypothetical protein
MEGERKQMARQKTDLSAALTGFVLGVVSLFLILTTIVILTNARYRNKEAAAAPATVVH